MKPPTTTSATTAKLSPTDKPTIADELPFPVPVTDATSAGSGPDETCGNEVDALIC